MATKIVTKNSSTASAVPTASDLVQGELAVNVADKRLFTEDNGGSIVELGTNPSSLTVSGNIDVDGVTNLDAVDIDGAVDMASTLTVTGEITANAGIALGDNDKATFGAGDDLQIYHTGSASVIEDQGTGDLVIKGTDLYLRNSSNSNRLYAGTDVRLYYSGSEKIRTTSTGIDVTGTATMDGLTVDGNAAVAGTTGVTVDTGTITTGKDSGSTRTHWRMNNPNGEVAKWDSNGTDLLHFITDEYKVYTAGNKAFEIDGNGDISFYEDTGTTPKLFWDASAESLGIGTSSPSSTLEIAKNDKTNGATLSITNTYNSSGYNAGDVVGTINFRTDDVSTTQPIRGQIKLFDDAASGSTYPFANAMSFSTGYFNTLNERMRIDSAGRVGIGTSSPSQALHVESSSSGTSKIVGALLNPNSGVVGTGAQLWLSGSNATTRGAYIEGQVRGSGNKHDLIFATNSDASTPEERMRIDSSGNVGIGTSSPAYKLDVAGNARANYFALRANESAPSESAFVYRPATGVLGFGTGTAERMRIDSSGNLLVGGTAINAMGSFTVRPDQNNGSCIVQMNRADTTATSAVIAFYNNNSTVGSITHNNTGTAYNTSSDQRLKDNIADADDAGSKIDSIQVRKYDWKADGSHQDYGMIAQELQAVAPEAVSGDADSEEMMGVDYSKLVPMLIKEIQSLRNRVAQLEE